MAKYDVELITDKHGKPMPQYFDEVEKKMKPITKDNFDGTINGSVDVEFPDVQKVEVTNQVDEVSIKELPNMSGTVEVTNLPQIQDVNVTNAIETVSIDNLPSDYPDQAVEARLQAIEQTQSQILNKLNDTIDTRLTGSNVEDAIPVEKIGTDAEIETLINSETIEAGGNTGRIKIDQKGCSRIIVAVNADVKWRMGTSSFWSDVANFNHTYPRRFDDQDESPNANYPSETVIGLKLNDATSYYDAIRNGFLPANILLQIFNRGETEGTFTIRIMRLWEV